MNWKVTLVVGSVVLLAGCVEDAGTSNVGMPSVGSSSDLSDFEGARAGQAEMGLKSLGYEAARTEGLTAYWYNNATNACARIVTSNGRYSEVDMVSANEC
ncbi:hypothetical protein ACFE33_05875 [Falsihalocynthiibacter sp. SS001]|uniref:hypothetical protein n=1 Tax=Falsihalocynthiibacter sp. SS001 TaxID=3349698 RepID=UPI0036D3EBF7